MTAYSCGAKTEFIHFDILFQKNSHAINGHAEKVFEFYKILNKYKKFQHFKLDFDKLNCSLSCWWGKILLNIVSGLCEYHNGLNDNLSLKSQK